MMGSRVTELPVNGYVVACLAVSAIFIAKLFQRSKLDVFPTAGSNNCRFGSWLDVLKFMTNAENIIQEGYKKHNRAPFKVAGLSNWTVILSDRRHLEELATASGDELSFLEATHDQLQGRYTLGHEGLHGLYHIIAVLSRLNRNIEVLCSPIRDEIVASFDDVLDLNGNEWKSVPALSAMQKIVCRTSNRVFVGLPLCRNADWMDLNIQYAMDVVKGGIIARLFPEFMRPLAVRFLTNIPQSTARARRLLVPIIEDRQKYANENGIKLDDKPNDFLAWLMDNASPELTPECLVSRVLVVNFAAIHSSSIILAQALFYLAASPQYMQPLREEVEGIVEKEGWTKIALGNMRKVDSFLRECIRFEGVKMISTSRKALRDFTFSDGTFIPKGTLVAAAAQCLHMDEQFYANPEVFEPFRFADLHEEEGKGQKYQFASATAEYMPFGFGRFACAGRLFAACELKFMLAHVVVTYDVKLEANTTRPLSWHVETGKIANPRAKILFRKRKY